MNTPTAQIAASATRPLQAAKKSIPKRPWRYFAMGIALFAVVATASAADVWTGAAADTLWSSFGNWNPATVPGPGANVLFTNIGTAGDGSTINNTVDAGFGSPINSLAYMNTNGFHNTSLVNPLIVRGTPATDVAFIADDGSPAVMFVGSGSADGTTAQVYTRILGASPLVVSNTSANLSVMQINGTDNAGYRATLDLTGLNYFACTVSNVTVGVDTGTASTRPHGTLLLAKTNVINAKSIAISDVFNNGSSQTSFVRLGQTNQINADTLRVGLRKMRGTMNFNAGLTMPTAMFRNSAGTGRETAWQIGDESGAGGSSSATIGIMDLTGGKVDALVDRISVGRGQDALGNGDATGTLTFGGGSINANYFELGIQQLGGGSVGHGTLNLNNDAGVGPASLLVNSNLVLAVQLAGNTDSAGSTADVNVNGGALSVGGNIVDGAGTSTLTVNNGGIVDLLPAGDSTPGNIIVDTLNIGAGVVTNYGALSVSTLNLLAPATSFTVAPGETIAPGGLGGPQGFLSVYGGGLTLRGTVAMDIAKNGNALTCDYLAVWAGTIDLGGTLSVSFTGDHILSVGDKYFLFGGFGTPAYVNSFTTLNLPPLTAGLAWTNKTAVNGSIEVVATSASPATLTLSTTPPSGGTIAVGQTVTAHVDMSVDPALPLTQFNFLVNDVMVASLSGPPYTIPLTVKTPGTMTVRAVASFENGLTASSGTSMLTVTGPVPAFAANSSLVLWLKADAGITTNGSGGVIGWTDQTTNGNNAVQGLLGNPPTFVANAANGMPVIHFDGVNDFEYLDVPYSPSLSITGDITMAVVVNVASNQFGQFGNFIYQGGDNAYPGPNGLTINNNGRPEMDRGTGSGNTQVRFPGLQSFPVAKFCVVTCNQAGSAMNQWLNSVPNGAITTSFVPNDPDMPPLHIGARGNLDNALAGDIAEILMFNSAVTGTNLDNLQSYLAAKYGVAVAVQGPNSPPLVSITNPTNGSSVPVSGNLTVNVNASDADGSIAEVELFANGFSLGAISAPPYQWPLQARTPGSVTLQAIATDNLGSKGTNTVSFLAAGNTNYAYSANANLVLWLKADAGVTTNGAGGITAWTDQSTYANNASAPSDGNAPTMVTSAINGLPAIHFAPVLTSYLTVPHSASLGIVGNIATFVVLKPASDNASDYRMIWYQGNSYPSPNAFMMFPGNVLVANRGNESAFAQDLFSAPNPAPALQYSVVGYSETGNVMSQFLNGFANGAPQTGSVTPVDGGGPLFIGSRGDFASYLSADVAEIMIFNAALTGTNLSTLETYLGTKYGIVQFGLPQPSLSIETLGNGTVRLSWPASYIGYVLESTSSMPPSGWTVVPGVANNQVIVTPAVPQFYRLRSQ